jgi:glutamyl-tRNA reductase
VGVEALATHSLDAGAAARLHEQLTGAGVESMALATCNRTELYWRAGGTAVDDAVGHAFGRLTRLSPGTGLLSGAAAAAHLFRVCAGLESLVLGEAEILGQVRAAIDGSPGAGPFLRGVVRAALRAGRHVRAETRLAVGAQSVASAAVQCLARALPLHSSHVLVVGAGATGLKIARHLRALGVGRLVVANRTGERAAAVASLVGAETVSFEALQEALPSADAVVVAVDAPSHVLTIDDLQAASAARQGPPLVAVDVSMPPAIASGDVAGITRVDLMEIERDIARQHDRRAAEVPKALAVIDRELRFLEGWARRQALGPLVSDLRRKMEGIRRRELARARAEMARPGGDMAATDGDAIDRLTRRLVDRLLAIPVEPLDAGRVTIDPDDLQYLRRLLALDEDSEA